MKTSCFRGSCTGLQEEKERRFSSDGRAMCYQHCLWCSDCPRMFPGLRDKDRYSETASRIVNKDRKSQREHEEQEQKQQRKMNNEHEKQA